MQKTQKVLAAEARAREEAKLRHKEARREDKYAVALRDEFNKPSHEAVPKGKLSASEERKEDKEWFKTLDKSVAKTPRVLAAEKRASEEKKALRQYDDETDEHEVKASQKWHQRQAVPRGRLSAKEYQEEQDKYFDQLSSQVCIT